MKFRCILKFLIKLITHKLCHHEDIDICKNSDRTVTTRNLAIDDTYQTTPMEKSVARNDQTTVIFLQKFVLCNPTFTQWAKTGVLCKCISIFKIRQALANKCCVNACNTISRKTVVVFRQVFLGMLSNYKSYNMLFTVLCDSEPTHNIF